MDPYSDPDYLRDSMQDDLRNDPVPCAVCGGPGAWHLVTLAPHAIFFGPIAPVRGICQGCKDARFVTQRLTYMKEAS
jgi:hypothetical protein